MKKPCNSRKDICILYETKKKKLHLATVGDEIPRKKQIYDCPIEENHEWPL